MRREAYLRSYPSPDSYWRLDRHLPKLMAIGLMHVFILVTAPLYPAFIVYSFDKWPPPSEFNPIELPIPSFYPK